MNIIIFGATGRVGSELTAQALADGHSVTAFVRNPAGIDSPNENLTVRKGDVFDLKAVEEAVAGQDVVLSALGDGRKGAVRETGTRNIIEAMKRKGVKRLISQSTLGTGDSNSTLNFFWKYIMFGMFLKAAFRDHEKQEALVRNSGLDWTIVRPAAFSEGELTGDYKHGSLSANDNLTLKISLKDVADFMLKQVTSKVYLNASPGLSY